MNTTTPTVGPPILAIWGFWAIVIGACAMVMVFGQMQLLASTENVPIGQQIGEIAGDIKRSAWRSFLGLPPPEPEVVARPAWTFFDILFAATPVAGGAAIILATISLLRREHWKLGFYGVALGGGAILFQFLWWMAILILGFLLLVKIIENIGDIFSFGG